MDTGEVKVMDRGVETAEGVDEVTGVRRGGGHVYRKSTGRRFTGISGLP